MDFKYYIKNVRRGPMSQKSYERWVMNDGVDPEDGVGGNRIGGRRQEQNRKENGAGRHVDMQVNGGGGGDNQKVKGRGKGRRGGFWESGRRQREYRGRFKGYGMGNQFHFHIF